MLCRSERPSIEPLEALELRAARSCRVPVATVAVAPAMCRAFVFGGCRSLFEGRAARWSVLLRALPATANSAARSAILGAECDTKAEHALPPGGALAQKRVGSSVG